MDRLRELRKEKNITMKQLGAIFGAAESTVSHWENGKRQPDNSTLSRLADYFGVSVDYLLGREKTKRRKMFRSSGKRYHTNLRKYNKELLKYFTDIPKDVRLPSKPLDSQMVSISVRPPRSSSETKNPPNVYDVDGIIHFEEIGTICAGFDGMINETPTGEIVELPSSMINGGDKQDYFVLRVSGNSMYPRLLDGDRILCKRCAQVENGNFAVVLYDGECATVKKIHYGDGYIDLIPINPEYETKRIEGADLDQCRILGKVIKLIRDL